MTTMYVCMTVGGTNAESSAKGLLVNMPDVSSMIPNFAGNGSRCSGRQSIIRK